MKSMPVRACWVMPAASTSPLESTATEFASRLTADGVLPYHGRALFGSKRASRGERSEFENRPVGLRLRIAFLLSLDSSGSAPVVVVLFVAAVHSVFLPQQTHPGYLTGLATHQKRHLLRCRLFRPTLDNQLATCRADIATAAFAD